MEKSCSRRYVRAACAAALALCLTDAVFAAEDTQYISLANPEDIIALPDTDYALVSSMKDSKGNGGAIVAVNTQTHTVTQVFPADASTGNAPAGSACPGAPDPAAFSAHGILLTGSGAETRLYVVNHGGRETIEIFSIRHDNGTVHGAWRDCLPLPEGVIGNSVAIIGDTVFTTNNGQALDGDKFNPFAADVLMWQADQGWQQVIPKHFNVPNGLVALTDSNRIYFTAWGSREVIELLPGKDNANYRHVDVPFMVDNIRRDADGLLLAAGHKTDLDSMTECYEHGDGRCPFTSALARIDPETMEVICYREFAVTPSFGAATVASPVAGQLWMGQARGGAIMIVPRLSPPSNDGGC